MQAFIALFIIFCIMYSLVQGSAPIKKVLSHWHHRFEMQPFSPQEFYEAIKISMERKEMGRVRIARVRYEQGGFLSPIREYLRIQYKDLIFDLCASPFGREFFVSWWLGLASNPLRDFLINLPVFGKLFKPRQKTFFELDTEKMFQDSVSASVREAIEQLTTTKGFIPSLEADWKPQFDAIR